MHSHPSPIPRIHCICLGNIFDTKYFILNLMWGEGDGLDRQQNVTHSRGWGWGGGSSLGSLFTWSARPRPLTAALGCFSFRRQGRAGQCPAGTAANGLPAVPRPGCGIWWVQEEAQEGAQEEAGAQTPTLHETSPPAFGCSQPSAPSPRSRAQPPGGKQKSLPRLPGVGSGPRRRLRSEQTPSCLHSRRQHRGGSGSSSPSGFTPLHRDVDRRACADHATACQGRGHRGCGTQGAPNQPLRISRAPRTSSS